MRNLISRLLPLVCLVGVVSACGQATPPQGDDTGTDDDAELSSLFPLVDGSTWTYRLEDASGSFVELENVTMEAIEGGWQGAAAFLQYDEANADGESTESVILRDGDIALRVHKEVAVDGTVTTIVDYDPGFVRADDAWLAAEAGAVFSYEYLRTEMDGEGANPVEQDRGHEYTILGVDEELVTNAGTFSTIHVSRESTAGDLAGEVVELWYAVGVGKVQEHRLANVDLALEEEWEKLIVYDIPGGSSGG